MDAIGIIRNELDQAATLLNLFKSDDTQVQKIADAADLISASIKLGGKVLACGNGGSHCDAMHFTEEMVGRFRDHRKPLPAIAISEPGYLTCTANDYGFEEIFSRAVEGLGQSGDVLLAISTSGNSINVIKAVEVARSKGLKTIILTGKDGGYLKDKGDVVIRVSHEGFADRIQEIHIKVIHILILLIEKQVS